MTLHLTVDGIGVDVGDGASALDAVLAAGVSLPHLCKDPDRPRIGSCRTCLVGIEGMTQAVASCVMPAADGMVITTTDPAIVHLRTGVLQLTVDMLAEKGLDKLAELGDAARAHGVTRGRFVPAPDDPRREAVDASNAFWVLDHARCILCQRCVVACQEVQRIGAIAMLGRASHAEIGTFRYGPVAASNCTSCGQCWATCPTLAIRMKTPMAESAIAGWMERQPGRRHREAAS